ncbi:hypothetical protein BDV27DRAFT_25547 [Aspergillus caelatus]|uniref:Uncharacterized protein n=1 Tax=Aspergillus caelatus TaxID=61420 RepID=A0A5N6ZWM0_9EURO|nr:uncharacterized protein BDV27DRAFT_25547 [Aspergillus caelatus]KAE8361785.1 hypothetical protein BDV27DRAFT_25547 [Aspergillus caelatus]
MKLTVQKIEAFVHFSWCIIVEHCSPTDPLFPLLLCRDVLVSLVFFFFPIAWETVQIFAFASRLLVSALIWCPWVWRSLALISKTWILVLRPLHSPQRHANFCHSFGTVHHFPFISAF